MSFNFSINSTVELAVNSLIDAGITVVNSAGNKSEDASNNSPARMADVLTVGAVDQIDQYAYFSNFGPAVEVFAPGVQTLRQNH